MKKNPRWILLTTALLVCIATTVAVRASPTTISLNPPEVEDLDLGESFTVNITVTDVTDLYSWDVYLTFDPEILNCTGFEEGPFLQQVATTTIWGQINNTAGFTTPGAILFDPAQGFPAEGATGSGVLATVTFTVKGRGVTTLHFERSKLNTVIARNTVPITHEATDGVFRNAAPTTLNIQLIIGVVVALAIVGIAVFFYMRRRT